MPFRFHRASADRTRSGKRLIIHGTAFDAPRGVVRQRSRRHARRHRRRPRADPRGHRLRDHRRRRSQGRALRLLLHRGPHRLHRRPPRHDLGRHRRHRRADGHAGPRPRPRIPARRHGARRPPADRRRFRRPRETHAFRFTFRDDRLRQRAGDPDLSRPAARADRRATAHLRHGRPRPRDHLPRAPRHPLDPLAADLHRRAHDPHHGARSRPAHRRRSRRPARHPADVPDPRHPAHARNPADHPALFHRRRRRGPAREPDDRADRRRAHRHALGQEPRMRRPGHRQHRHRLSRRHGGLRDDRPVDHQREIRRPRPALDPHRRRRACCS